VEDVPGGEFERVGDGLRELVPWPREEIPESVVLAVILGSIISYRQ